MTNHYLIRGLSHQRTCSRMEAKIWVNCNSVYVIITGFAGFGVLFSFFFFKATSSSP